eukprot:TRINITY_DN2332_c0_g1_i1.p1 TRINITY_DN2332_c0_g1~~TRINITY_DN2332_c0_g1_i1.p1  ORF type:complete len:365 (+),score=44.01 TRINITY_DN2332_c0_g1_i1:328-1422(+)
MFSAGMVGIFLFMIFGILMDILGPRLSAIMHHLIVMVGLALLAVADEDSEILFYVSVALLYVSGLSVSTGNMHNSQLFPGFEATIQSCYVMMFTSGALIFTIENSLQNAFGLNRFQLLMILIGFQVPCLFIAYFLGYDRPFKRGDSTHDNLKSCCFSLQKPDLQLSKSFNVVKSFKFLYTCLFFCLTGLVSNLFITTVNPQIEFVASSLEEASVYTEIYYYIFPISAIAVPFLGLLIDLHVSAATGICLILMYVYLILLAFPVWIEQQIFTFLIYSLSRPILFAATFAVIKEWGFDIFGRLTGIAYVIFGIVSLGQFALVDLTYDTLGGNFQMFNIICGIILLPLIPYPIYYNIQSRRSNYESL